MPRRFAAWLGQNSSSGKQRRLLGELHTRMLSSGAVHVDRGALRQAYLPVLRQALTAPMAAADKEGIPAVLETMRVRPPHQQTLRLGRVWAGSPAAPGDGGRREGGHPSRGACCTSERLWV